MASQELEKVVHPYSIGDNPGLTEPYPYLSIYRTDTLETEVIERVWLLAMGSLRRLTNVAQNK